MSFLFHMSCFIIHNFRYTTYRFFFDIYQSPIMEWLFLGAFISINTLGIYTSFTGLFFVIGNNLNAQFKILNLRLNSLVFDSTDEKSCFDEIKKLVKLQTYLLEICGKFKKFYAFLLSTLIIHATFLISMQGFIFVTVSANGYFILILMLVEIL